MKNFGEELDDAVNSFKESKEMINKIFDVQEKIIDFLIANKGKWDTNENNEIEFDNTKLVNEYNSYLEEL